MSHLYKTGPPLQCGQSVSRLLRFRRVGDFHRFLWYSQGSSGSTEFSGLSGIRILRLPRGSLGPLVFHRALLIPHQDQDDDSRRKASNHVVSLHRFVQVGYQLAFHNMLIQILFNKTMVLSNRGNSCEDGLIQLESPFSTPVLKPKKRSTGSAQE